VSVIGLATQPECFRRLADCLPLKYFSEKNAWMNADVCRLWFFSFFEAVAAFKAFEAVVFLDNASGHLTKKETYHVSV